jgi:hypothetical protein
MSLQEREFTPNGVLTLDGSIRPAVPSADVARPRALNAAAVVPLFSTALFTSAFLLFLVEPMIAKMALPILGGAPMVWNTCVVFFQIALLAGYGYAHGAARAVDVRKHLVAHVVLLLVPLWLLPFAIGPGAAMPPRAQPVIWLLGLLAITIGAPFFILSTTASVLQDWLSRTRHPSGRDPYFLYAASNFGSLLALAAYPTIIEPMLPLRAQARAWAYGYAAFVVLIAACAAVVWRWIGDDAAARPSVAQPAHSTVGAARRLRWIALAFVPSSLMLAVTNFISTDIAAVPLLWIVPLGIYLLTFSMAFGRRAEMSRSIARVAVPLLFVPLVMLIVAGVRSPLMLVLPIHLAAFGAAALACHGELAGTRPAADRVTEFYFWISFGGMLGGLFNTLAAPLLFSGITEYPLVLACTCLLLTGSGTRTASRRIVDVALPALVAASTIGILWMVHARALAPGFAFAMLGAPALAVFAGRRRPVRFATAIAAMLAAGTIVGPGERVLQATRTFFGVYRVFVDASSRYHALAHGTTLHGMQSLDPARRHEPLTYFHPTGPAGQAFADLPKAQVSRNIAVIGLGVGTLAAYHRDGQQWTFFEIDPAVERIARSTEYFTFLPDCGPACRVVIGDARLSLAHASGARYGVIVLDAFSSDAIPIHLITDEAVSLYLDRLEAGGALVFHISNRHLDLGPILARLATHHGLVAEERVDLRTPGWPEGKSESRWVVMARNRADLGAIALDPRWNTPAVRPSTPLWTDDFSNILSVLRLE